MTLKYLDRKGKNSNDLTCLPVVLIVFTGAVLGWLKGGWIGGSLGVLDAILLLLLFSFLFIDDRYKKDDDILVTFFLSVSILIGAIVVVIGGANGWKPLFFPFTNFGGLGRFISGLVQFIMICLVWGAGVAAGMTIMSPVVALIVFWKEGLHYKAFPIVTAFGIVIIVIGGANHWETIIPLVNHSDGLVRLLLFFLFSIPIYLCTFVPIFVLIILLIMTTRAVWKKYSTE